jgi:ribosomal protein S18 acetylase RimI-like enzyme
MGSAARLVDELAHRWAGGRWLATGGGGYGVYRVVPRAWAHVWLAGAHREVPNRLPAEWRERWTEESARYGDPSLPAAFDDEPNAGLPPSPTQAVAEEGSLQTAELARRLSVPRLIREAVDGGWWSPRAASSGADPATLPPADTAGAPTILDRPDRATLDRLEFAPRLVGGLDPGSLRAILDPSRVEMTLAVADAAVVGLAASMSSAADGDGGDARRSLLAVGVLPDWRRQGLASELLAHHVGSFEPAPAWTAMITAAERDPYEPLDRMLRATIARRLLEQNGFAVSSAGGEIGRADPPALEATRR